MMADVEMAFAPARPRPGLGWRLLARLGLCAPPGRAAEPAELAGQLDALLAAQQRGEKLPLPVQLLYRRANLDRHLRDTSSWCLSAGVADLIAALFDLFIIPPARLELVLGVRVAVCLCCFILALAFRRRQARAAAPALIMGLCVLAAAAGGSVGLLSGQADQFLNDLLMGGAIACSGLIYGRLESNGVMPLAGILSLTLCGFTAFSPIPRPAQRLQVMLFYSLFLFGLGFARNWQERLQTRLFLLQLREELRAQEASRRNDQLSSIAYTDPLTGIANRRGFDEVLQALTRDSSWAVPVALCLFDIDHFKIYNDRFGHVQGDACLRDVALTVRAQLRRQTDILARYGGEEFALVLPNTGIAAALEIMERVRLRVLELGRSNPGSAHGLVTLSGGVALAFSDAELPGLVQAADQALYRAKQRGRNQVCV